MNSLEKFAQEVAPAFTLIDNFNQTRAYQAAAQVPVATSESIRSNRESFLNLELSNTAATSAEVNLQISQHEANRVLRLENQLNSNSILHAQFFTENLDVDADTDFNTQLDELPGSACYCNMDTTSTALDIRAFETTGDHTRELDDDRSMDIVMYDDVFEIVGTKRKLTPNPEYGGSRCSSP